MCVGVCVYPVISSGVMASKEDEKVIMNLFGGVGKVWTAEEKYFDAVTGLRCIVQKARIN